MGKIKPNCIECEIGIADPNLDECKPCFEKETHHVTKCEICGSELQWTLIDEYHPETKYKVCSNCLSQLTNYNLPGKSWKKLIANGHNENEFLLHEDFYDEEGNALQPM